MKNKIIFKKFFVLFILNVLLFGNNFVFAEDEIIPNNEETTITIDHGEYFSIEKSIILKNSCEVKDTDGETHIFPQENSPSEYLGICALVSAKEAGYINGFELKNDPSLGLYIQSINNVEPNSTEYWAIYINGGYANCGLGCLSVSEGDTLLLVFTAFDPVTYAETKLDYSVTIKIEALGEQDKQQNETQTHHSSSGSAVGSYPNTNITEKVFNLENAFKFLETNQKVDGSFGDYLYTDWAAIAFVAGDSKEIKEKLIKYYKENNLESNLITDNERHAMALMSLGINPYNETKVNYIKKITDGFDGVQFGDKTLVNDDIFALVVLKNAGYGEKDEIVLKDVNYLISKQDSSGSLGGIDMTSAFIQVMRGFENMEGVSDSILKAEKYLISKQEEDGDFGNSFSASWALQAISENSTFTTQIAKAESYLVSKQQLDGGLENIIDNIDTRIWATSYAIPAILHKLWSEILQKFDKEKIEIEVFPRQGLGEDKVGEVKKINKGIIKKSEKTLEDRAKIENLIEDNNLPQNNKIQSKASRVWRMLKAPFSRLLVKLGF